MVSFTSLVLAVSALASANAATTDYATYPSVAHTASINGVADKIYDLLSECAKACVATDTSSTPCPYWDTGCLCVMSTWGDVVADCIASSCSGTEVSGATSLIVSLCSSAGVWDPYWIIGTDALSALEAAATGA